MTRQEHLLVIAMEECEEVAHRIAKALRFGMDQVQQDTDDHPEQNPNRLSNRDRIIAEYFDLRAVLGMAGLDAWESSARARSAEAEKVRRVGQYLERSRANGTLDDHRCTCWLGRTDGATFGSSHARERCAVHGQMTGEP